jgi:hypothetical protein
MWAGHNYSQAGSSSSKDWSRPQQKEFPDENNAEMKLDKKNWKPNLDAAVSLPLCGPLA